LHQACRAAGGGGDVSLLVAALEQRESTVWQED
jgi:hypothetical protein